MPTPMPTPAPAAQSAATPDNTPIPGGGSWCWSDTAPHWLPNTPAPEPQPLQPGDTPALQPIEPTQE